MTSTFNNSHRLNLSARLHFQKEYNRSYNYNKTMTLNKTFLNMKLINIDTTFTSRPKKNIIKFD